MTPKHEAAPPSTTPHQTLMRCVADLPLAPQTDAQQEEKVAKLAQWDAEIRRLEACGWEVVLESTTRQLHRGTYRLVSTLQLRVTGASSEGRRA